MADRIKPKMGRRPKAYSQADRFARMLRVLSTRAVSVRDLAQELGISVRQVYRDLDGMQKDLAPASGIQGPAADCRDAL